LLATLEIHSPRFYRTLPQLQRPSSERPTVRILGLRRTWSRADRGSPAEHGSTRPRRAAPPAQYSDSCIATVGRSPRNSKRAAPPAHLGPPPHYDLCQRRCFRSGPLRRVVMMSSSAYFRMRIRRSPRPRASASRGSGSVAALELGPRRPQRPARESAPDGADAVTAPQLTAAAVTTTDDLARAGVRGPFGRITLLRESRIGHRFCSTLRDSCAGSLLQARVARDDRGGRLASTSTCSCRRRVRRCSIRTGSSLFLQASLSDTPLRGQRGRFAGAIVLNTDLPERCLALVECSSASHRRRRPDMSTSGLEDIGVSLRAKRWSSGEGAASPIRTLGEELC